VPSFLVDINELDDQPPPPGTGEQTLLLGIDRASWLTWWGRGGDIDMSDRSS
jgi:hypothetical protein